MSDIIRVGYISFQSTLPRRERLSLIPHSSMCSSYFNPRSHEGSDTEDIMFCFPFSHFNPRSHEGSDCRRRVHSITAGHFNPRSHEGSDTIATATIVGLIYFNPRSHEGSDSNIAQNNEFILWNIDK